MTFRTCLGLAVWLWGCSGGETELRERSANLVDGKVAVVAAWQASAGSKLALGAGADVYIATAGRVRAFYKMDNAKRRDGKEIRNFGAPLLGFEGGLAEGQPVLLWQTEAAAGTLSLDGTQVTPLVTASNEAGRLSGFVSAGGAVYGLRAPRDGKSGPTVFVVSGSSAVDLGTMEWARGCSTVELRGGEKGAFVRTVCRAGERLAKATSRVDRYTAGAPTVSVPVVKVEGEVTAFDAGEDMAYIHGGDLYVGQGGAKKVGPAAGSAIRYAAGNVYYASKPYALARYDVASGRTTELADIRHVLSEETALNVRDIAVGKGAVFVSVEAGQAQWHLVRIAD